MRPPTICFIINGQDVPLDVRFPSVQTLRELRNRALRNSGNTGRPFDDFEVRSDTGDLLDLDAPVSEMKLSERFPYAARVWATIRTGVGGCTSIAA